jgi:hypothetical protein
MIDSLLGYSAVQCRSRHFRGPYCLHLKSDDLRRSASTKLHGAICQKAVIMLAAMRTGNVSHNKVHHKFRNTDYIYHNILIFHKSVCNVRLAETII